MDFGGRELGSFKCKFKSANAHLFRTVCTSFLIMNSDNKLKLELKFGLGQCINVNNFVNYVRKNSISAYRFQNVEPMLLMSFVIQARMHG